MGGFGGSGLINKLCVIYMCCVHTLCVLSIKTGVIICFEFLCETRGTSREPGENKCSVYYRYYCTQWQLLLVTKSNYLANQSNINSTRTICCNY